MTIDTDAQPGPQGIGPVGPGIVLVDPVSSADVSQVAQVWRNAGWRVVHMSGGADLEAVLAGFGRVLSFPSRYGRNLDALRDCLADMRTDTAVLWSGWQPFQCDSPRDWGRLVDTIGQCLDEDKLDGFALLLV
ncbi:barstar family protein [Cutibacterium sp.]|uniref:barstar family protein n=1 Tax=Cutibacterium sp. TaxID=1912221 RepID=UPI0026DCE08B|nr:barstar family protein [Cutibacterium sp.]MDO4411618.1 barstar family protein [Cutibacterium sp.]